MKVKKDLADFWGAHIFALLSREIPVKATVQHAALVKGFKTHPFHGWITGSIPVRGTNEMTVDRWRLTVFLLSY